MVGVVGMVTCRRVPGPPAFLVNVENLGVAWGQGYNLVPSDSHEQEQFPALLGPNVFHFPLLHNSDYRYSQYAQEYLHPAITVTLKYYLMHVYYTHCSYVVFLHETYEFTFSKIARWRCLPF